MTKEQIEAKIKEELSDWTKLWDAVDESYRIKREVSRVARLQTTRK